MPWLDEILSAESGAYPSPWPRSRWKARCSHATSISNVPGNTSSKRHPATATLVLLPELFSTGLCYDVALCAHAEPIGGHTTRWLRTWSRATGCCIGGTIIECCGQSCFNTFVLTTPDGTTSIYRKRLPPFFENFVFGRGSRTGIIDTPLGRLGVLICWDMVQDRMVQRCAAASTWWRSAPPGPTWAAATSLCRFFRNGLLDSPGGGK